jgi:hypothetical protein
VEGWVKELVIERKRAQQAAAMAEKETVSRKSKKRARLDGEFGEDAIL